MGINYYDNKHHEKIKTMLKENGHPSLKNIPLDAYQQCMMIIFGMSRKGADKWMSNFETVGLIHIKHIDECNWVVDIVEKEA
jgi:hypothetical protein